eukprot:6629623-Prymnesium_polylepis.2
MVICVLRDAAPTAPAATRHTRAVSPQHQQSAPTRLHDYRGRPAPAVLLSRSTYRAASYTVVRACASSRRLAAGIRRGRHEANPASRQRNGTNGCKTRSGALPADFAAGRIALLRAGTRRSHLYTFFFCQSILCEKLNADCNEMRAPMSFGAPADGRLARANCKARRRSDSEDTFRPYERESRWHLAIASRCFSCGPQEKLETILWSAFHNSGSPCCRCLLRSRKAIQALEPAHNTSDKQVDHAKYKRPGLRVCTGRA